MTIDAQTRWDVTEILSRYGHVVDNQAWGELGSVFSEAAVVTTQHTTASGLADIRAYLESFDPKRSHHNLNTILRSDADGVVHAWSRFIVVEFDASSVAGDYVDELVHTPAGWRIRSRRISPRNRPGLAPGGEPWRVESFATWT